MKKEYVEIGNQVKIAYSWIIPKINQEDFIVVFIHEAIGSIGQWKQFPQLICNGLNAKGFVYERQGYGDSSPLTEKRGNDYLEKYAIEELPQIVGKLFPDKKIVTLGHSDGGSIALMYASKFPDKIKAVITMAAHVVVEEKTIEGFQPILKAYQEGKFDGLRKYHGTRMNDVFHAWYDTWNSDEYRSWNICEKIHQNLPTLILQGDNDEYATLHHVQLIAERLENPTIVIIPNCHHQPHLEKPDEVVRIIVDWLSRLK